MGNLEEEERAVECLQNALNTDDIAEKDYHIRQAFHLLTIDIPDEDEVD